MIIKEIRAREIKDSRGDLTIEVFVNGCKASSPNGKSTGKYETRPYYKSLRGDIDFLNSFDKKIEIKKFDELIKVENAARKRLGANSLYAFESAILKALAKEKGVDLWEVINSKARKFPFPVGNVVGGGLHSSSLENRPEFQEFLVIPQAKKFSDNVKIMNFIYNKLQGILKTKEKNDEGALLVGKNNKEILDLLNKVKVDAENKFGVKIGVGIDAASSTFYRGGKYFYKDSKLSQKEQLRFMEEIIFNYGLFYLEDPLYEKDFKRFAKITKKSGDCLIAGDDLTATQIKRVRKAIRKKSINAMIIKPNQNGSLLELKEIFDICKKAGIKTILSHRSGETMDDALADYAFGFQADFIKCGVSTRWREGKLGRMEGIERAMRR